MFAIGMGLMRPTLLLLMFAALDAGISVSSLNRF